MSSVTVGLIPAPSFAGPPTRLSALLVGCGNDVRRAERRGWTSEILSISNLAFDLGDEIGPGKGVRWRILDGPDPRSRSRILDGRGKPGLTLIGSRRHGPPGSPGHDPTREFLQDHLLDRPRRDKRPSFSLTMAPARAMPAREGGSNRSDAQQTRLLFARRYRAGIWCAFTIPVKGQDYRRCC